MVCAPITRVPCSVCRWSRPLRPLLIINIPESRQIRRAWRSVSRTLPDVAGTMVLFLLNLLLFALMAFKLFGNRLARVRADCSAQVQPGKARYCSCTRLRDSWKLCIQLGALK